MTDPLLAQAQEALAAHSYVTLTEDDQNHRFSVDAPLHHPALGIIAEVRLWANSPWRHSEVEVVLASPDQLTAEAIERSVRRITAARERLADPERFRELIAADADALAAELELERLRVSPEVFVTTPADVTRREAALQRALDLHPKVAAHMQAVYGLRLPRTLAVVDAFFRSLTAYERRADIGLSPTGILDWFDDGGLTRATRDGLDPRLHWRYRSDPPELVTIMSGDSDGLHYGLWYDDPAELPSAVAHNYARDSAETWRDPEPTPLRVIHACLQRRVEGKLEYGEPIRGQMMAFRAALEWFLDRDDAIFAEEGPGRWASDARRRPEITGGFLTHPPEGSGDHRSHSYDQVRQRYQAIRARSPKVTAWIDTARAELRDGKPAFALALGRELHWFDLDDYRDASLELLAGAYRTLGRNALAGIVEVHHAHRDLRSVAVYA